MTDDVSLKEHIEKRLCALESLTAERFTSRDKTLQNQAAEYERRLSDLNGEAGRLRSIQITYLPREVYEARMKEVEAKIDDLCRGRDRILGRDSVIALLVAFGTSLAVVLVTYFIWEG